MVQISKKRCNSKLQNYGVVLQVLINIKLTFGLSECYVFIL